MTEITAPDRQWRMPRSAKAPGWLLAAPMIAAFLYYFVRYPEYGMYDWGVSGQALAEGRWWTLLIHMFAHGGILHIAMNMAVLIGLSPILVLRLGRAPTSWVRYFGLFFVSGLAGAAVYLAINPHGAVPMLGASGAIYGLVGALLRVSPDGPGLMPLWSREMALAVRRFVTDNLLLIVIFTVPAFLSGSGGGLAWEAHVGGFAFGLIAGPLFFPRSRAMNI
ncbi:rhomboid family intramembrane serine protease [Sphingomonas immobilis]|uniref:Rhomboid family intramembrane serine protease n=1 Tax=Sphingomonas immobilis TaxID=3063997 RepID=A0ABT9A0K3_9SPHN|nr:rhomboid family intramembrane serine protease [Sphingomonas sp. CA1-15]MDO7842780.1 rhomboid family intramembrane serine protease [Sphingomonas sp. CA1-15]